MNARNLLSRSAAATAIVAMTIGLSSVVNAASLLTSSTGYTGPKLSIGSIGQPYYDFSAGPLALPGGLTYTSTDTDSVVGDGGYALASNGFNDEPIIGTNDGFATVTLTFSTPVSSFGTGFNYAPNYGYAPTISAYDSSHSLIASYDLASLAPISTPGETNAYRFRGIDAGGDQIAQFMFSGSYLIAQASAVPEPTCWALMLLGLGSAGAAMRMTGRKRRYAELTLHGM